VQTADNAISSVKTKIAKEQPLSAQNPIANATLPMQNV
jgi:hypothetical protein